MKFIPTFLEDSTIAFFKTYTKDNFFQISLSEHLFSKQEHREIEKKIHCRWECKKILQKHKQRSRGVRILVVLEAKLVGMFFISLFFIFFDIFFSIIKLYSHYALFFISVVHYSPFFIF